MPWVTEMNELSTFLTKAQSEIEADKNDRRREIKRIEGKGNQRKATSRT